MNHKLNRLRKQIDFLGKLHGDEVEVIPSTYEAHVAKKFHLMKKLRVRSFFATDEIVTNKSALNFPDLPAFTKINSGYSGQDFQAVLDPENDFFYPCKGPVFFTTSGQSAITAALMFFFDIFSAPDVRHSPQLYHEAADFLQFLKKISGDSGERKISYIDSSAFEVTDENLAAEFKDCEFLLIDTTCWEMRSEETEKIFHQLSVSHVPALLVRSHVKLDSLGAEYGLLGSIVLFGGNLNADQILKFSENLKKKIAITRASAGYTDLYPFWVKGEFAKLTHERTLDIKRNTRLIEKCIADKISSPMTLRTFPHSLFCLIELPSKENVRELLLKSSRLPSVPFLVCDSFGFDQLSVTYIDYTNDSKKCALRVCGSDLEEKDVIANIVILMEALKRLFPGD
jgi:hypothetical protein